MRRSRTWRLLVVLFAMPLQGRAQAVGAAKDKLLAVDTLKPSDISLLLPSSYVAWTGGSLACDGPRCVLDRSIELNLQSHLRVYPRLLGNGWNTWPKRTEYHADFTSNGGWRVTWDWTFSVMARLHTAFRGDTAESAPIRTPSIAWEWLPWPAIYHLARDTAGTSARVVLGTFGLNHYSNGQSGCTLQGFRRERIHSGDCIRADSTSPRPPRDTLNILDGSFSTNYLTLGMSYAKFRLDTTSGPRIGSVLGGWGFSAEYRNYRQVGSVLTLIPGQADSLLLARFGTRELSGKVWWQPAWLNSCRLILVCWLSPSSRLAAVTVGLDNWGKLGPDGPLQFEVEGFRRFGGTDVRHNRRGGSASLKWLFFNEESGLLLRRYQGSNYYNINFEEPAEAFWMIGLTFEHGRQRTFGQYRKPNSTS